MQRFFEKFNKKNTGFTLIETLVAISIFTMSILGLMSVLTKGVSDIGYAKKKIIATYLAQEGIEYMRNLRDTYVLFDLPNGWDNFKNKLNSGGCNGANGCYFDDSLVNYGDQDKPITNINLINCTPNCANMLYDPTNGKYGYSGPVNVGMIRKITLQHINANETKIYSTVYWIQGSGTKQVTFSGSLFNWQE